MNARLVSFSLDCFEINLLCVERLQELGISPFFIPLLFDFSICLLFVEHYFLLKVMDVFYR